MENQETKVLNEYATDLYMCADSLGMTDWEKDFSFDMVGKVNYSTAQASKILQLAEKYEL